MMNHAGLYEPSLSQESVRTTKSYNIINLFFVAFFGGVIAITVLGLRNSKWLHIKPAVRMAFLAAAVMLFMAKYVFIYALINHLIDIDKQSIKFLLRSAEVLLFGGFYLVLRKPFQQHLVLGGNVEPLKKDGIVWSIFSMFIEIGTLVATLTVFS